MNKKLCIYCEHLFFDGGFVGTYETPGTNWIMKCQKGYWDFDAEYAGREDFIKTIEIASKCPDYEEVEI